MADKNKQQVAVIGAGIIGICSALQLQRAGFAVTLYDENGLAQGCSKGNAGHFATEQVFPLAHPSLLKKLPGMLFNPLGPLRIDWRYGFKALPWFWQFVKNMPSKTYRTNTQALKALNQLAIPAYERLLSEYNLGHLLTKKGSLLTFETTPLSKINAMLRSYLDQGIEVELLDGEHVRLLEPNLAKTITYALLFKEVAHSVDPHLFCLNLAEQFSALGGQFCQQKITSIQPAKQGYTLSCQNQIVTANKVVIAAGAWSNTLLKPLGYKVPLDTERGYHCMLAGNYGLSRPVASAERHFIMTPMSQGLRIAGTVEFAGTKRKMNNKRALALLPNAKALLNRSAFSLHANSTWMGCRPSLPDSLPVIGSAPNHDNLYFAFGHQHLGLTQGAVTAELITALCLNHPPQIDIHPYCVSRFSTQPACSKAQPHAQ
ncbi:FAD-binding oxidoreductase [Pseudoalteromonas sp. SG44-1]|uniref:NAD(P)/FAD-dependent oxidoreductase n=1 Tax=unclassified Pseudoalteromonas TaxID=194690 RepID=UPI0015FFADBD|nr:MULTISPECIES: FAD-dependent oxidoreductase [unclassified Pseudoalteromonas]MBB1416754.1 FAD-binding oxidoreductase [Pseudoalteromonas sp. SG44-1]MBB1470907.1 FAD-binding oxidoreductase [Pseudoalteromonas sp. SG41-5]